MLKKKKVLLTTIGLFAGVSVFATTAFVALANNSGYESFRKALIKTTQTKNFELDSNIEINYEGEVVGKVITTQKTDGTNSYFYSKQVSANNEAVNDYAYYSDSNTVTNYRDGKVVGESKAQVGHPDITDSIDGKSESLKASEAKLIEVLMDTLVGDSKNFIISEGKKIYANLDETQIPNLAQAGLNFASELGKEAMINEKFAKSQDIVYNENSLEGKMLDLSTLDKISIKNINFKGEIGDDDFVKNAYLKIDIGGIDKTGKNVTYSFTVDVNVSNVGKAVVTKP